MIRTLFTLSVFATMCLRSGTAGPILTVSVLPETSASWPAGTTFGAGFTSQSASALAPFSGQSVQLRGTQQGGSTETLNGAGLVYRYELDYDQAVTISSIVVQGAAFNGPNSILRLLNAQRTVLDSIATSGGNTFQTFTLNTPGATGTVFFLDEFDTSTTWRFRSDITINAAAVAPEPGSLCLLAASCLALIGLRRRSVQRHI
jgi:hypothetical protein